MELDDREPFDIRICSLLPSATEIVAGLGLMDRLVAISHECDYPPEIQGKPVVIESVVDAERSSSVQIDEQVRSALRTGRGLYRIKDSLLRQANPTLVLTQDLCEVCAVTPNEVHRALAGLPGPAQLISLNPSSLQDVFRDIETIAAATGRSEAARRWSAGLKERVERVRVRVNGKPLRPVACLEWLDPLYTAGHWVPELVKIAGGHDMLGEPGMKSAIVSWDDVQAAAPEVLTLMPCGFSIDRTFKELHHVTSRPGWDDLPAVRHGEVYAVDGPAHFNRPGPRLVEGLELLARLLHPDCFGTAPLAGARRIP